MTLDTALWIGCAGNFLADGTPLIPGVTIAHVPEGEAIASDDWSPIDAGRPAEAGPPSVFDGGTFRAQVLDDGEPGYVNSTSLGGLDGGAP